MSQALSDFANSYQYGMSSSSGSWLSDVWGGVTNVLEQGLDIYQDYLNIEGSYHGNYNGNPDAFVEYNKPQDNTTAPTTPTTPVTVPGQWVPGISNTVVMAAGVGLIALIALKG